MRRNLISGVHSFSSWSTTVQALSGILVTYFLAVKELSHEQSIGAISVSICMCIEGSKTEMTSLLSMGRNYAKPPNLTLCKSFQLYCIGQVLSLKN